MADYVDSGNGRRRIRAICPDSGQADELAPLMPVGCELTVQAKAGLSGALIGPPGTPRDYGGSLEGTPVFLGCSDVDAHIPAARVRETADTLTRLGGIVTLRLYAGMGHTINDEEMRAVRAMVIDALAASA